MHDYLTHNQTNVQSLKNFYCLCKTLPKEVSEPLDFQRRFRDLNPEKSRLALKEDSGTVRQTCTDPMVRTPPNGEPDMFTVSPEHTEENTDGNPVNKKYICGISRHY